MSMDKVILIAGASGEIGAATARSLAAPDTMVYLGYNSNSCKADELADEILGMNCKAAAIQLDLSDASVINDVCQKIFDKENRLTSLINCAAINIESAALGMEDDIWDKVIDVNLDGAFKLSRAAARYIMLSGGGQIVHMSSIAGSYGGRGQINYASAKAGLEAMVRVLALELGRKKVQVNCIAPGIIETEMSERVRKEYGKELLSHVAMRRFGKPEEIAEVVKFLVSESASYITGQVIHVNGGMGL